MYREGHTLVREALPNCHVSPAWRHSVIADSLLPGKGRQHAESE
jgi:hypothetical protein